MRERDMKIDIEKLEEQHNATYDIETEIGTVTLRALPQLEFDLRTQELMAADPAFGELMKELLYLEDISGFPDGLDAEQAARLAHLHRRAAEWSEWFMIECFVEPVLTHPKQMRVLSSEMGGEDWPQVYEMLGTLTNPMRASERDKRLAAIYLKYGVPFAADITAGNITVQQAGVIDEVRAEEHAKAEQLWQEMQRGQ